MAPTELTILKLLKENYVAIVPEGKPTKKSQWKKLPVTGGDCLKKDGTCCGKSSWLVCKTYSEVFMIFWLGLDKRQVHTKTALSLPLICWTGESK